MERPGALLCSETLIEERVDRLEDWQYIIAATVGPALPFFVLLYRVGFRYGFGDENIEIRLFNRLLFRTIPYDEIEGFKNTTRKLYVTPFSVRYTSRLMGPSVTIYLKGLRLPVEVTPDYPYEFISKVSEHVHQQTGRWPWVR